MGKISSYADVADSEDEFHLQRDKIMLDGGPEAKRRKRLEEEDAGLEPSDDEILGYSSESEDEEEEEDSAASRRSAPQNDEEEEQASDEEDVVEGWGASRKEYYNTDTIETEAHALEEEAEAKRIQQKKLQKMSEADFGFDENEWLENGNDDEDADVVTEVLKDIEITPDMQPEERLRLLQTRYPEFEFLANEYLQLQPALADLQTEVEQESKQGSDVLPISVNVVKCRALAAYLGALAMYFALLTSPASGTGIGNALDPSELRDHAVMDSLLQCRELWSKVQSLKAPSPVEDISEDESMIEVEEIAPEVKLKTNGVSKPIKLSKKQRALETAAAEASALRQQRIQEADDDLQTLSARIPKTVKRTKHAKAVEISDNNSDFGEEEEMDEKSAAAKAAKKKSLRFYTSQIVQKSNKRAGAGRDAGGDMDVPIKERFRDRQQRLNAEAAARGKKLDEYGRGKTALGGDSDDEDAGAAVKMREDEDEYYDLVAKTSTKKRSDKATLQASELAAQEAAKLNREGVEMMDEEGKRAIGYTIQKNKGLAPKRKKEVRNPRVKKRMKFEEKKKKLSSVRSVYKGGEERGGYGGEKTGIKTGLVKSIKL